VAVLSVLPDRAVAQQITTLTAMDYIEIQQLVNRLNFALDYCTSGGRAFADLFVEGGQFIIDQGGGKMTVRRTRNELIALAGGPDCASRRSPPNSYILHLAESLVIEPAADGAQGGHTQSTLRARAAITTPTRPANSASITTNT
jgi:hypothetical protein